MNPRKRWPLNNFYDAIVMMHVFKQPFLLLFFVLAGATIAIAQSGPQDVQDRMRARLPEVDALKQQQLVGENLKGFLEPRGRLDVKADALVKEENADRKIAYEAIAAQTRANADQVGRIRAKQIADRSAKGVLIQTPRGAWEAKR